MPAMQLTRRMRLAALLLSCLLAAAAGAESGVRTDATPAVLHLTGDTFEELIGGSAGMFVEFYAPWCVHCQALAPEYERVGAAFAGSSDVRIAAIDADRYQVELERAGQGVQGYPTLRWFPAHAAAPMEEYTGANRADSIVRFVNAKAGTSVALPPDADAAAAQPAGSKPGAVSSVLALTPDNIEAIIGGPTPVLVEFFAPWCGHCKALAPEYELAAQAFREHREAVLVAALDADAYPALGHAYEIQGFPTLKYFPAHSKTAQEYTGTRKAAGLVSFLNQQTGLSVEVPASADYDPSAALNAAAAAAFAYPSVLKLDGANVDEHIGGAVGVLVEFYAPWCAHCKSLAPEYEEAAAAFKDVSGAKIAALDCDAHRELATRFGVKGFPTIQWFAPGSTTGVEYDGARTSAGLIKFVNKQAGTSAAVPGMPAPTGPSHVVQLDAQSFDTIVHDESKDVLVYFYAPWCAHCRRLSPEYEKAAALLASSQPELVVAALDCDEYPSLAAHVDAFPTLLLYPRALDAEADASDAVHAKRPEELNLGPSTMADGLVELVRAHLAGEAPAGAPHAAAGAAAPAPSQSSGGGQERAHTLSLVPGAASFFHCSLSGSALPAGAELRLDARRAEVPSFPASFSIDAEQFCTYNWQATPVADATDATVSITFIGGQPAGVELSCQLGRGQGKPDIHSVSN